MEDPFGLAGYIYTGPGKQLAHISCTFNCRAHPYRFIGFRVPMHIISPWTRGQKVFTEHADHASQIMFVG